MRRVAPLKLVDLESGLADPAYGLRRDIDHPQAREIGFGVGNLRPAVSILRIISLCQIGDRFSIRRPVKASHAFLLRCQRSRLAVAKNIDLCLAAAIGQKRERLAVGRPLGRAFGFLCRREIVRRAGGNIREPKMRRVVLGVGIGDIGELRPVRGKMQVAGARIGECLRGRQRRIGAAKRRKQHEQSYTGGTSPEICRQIHAMTP
jgi:hypothetical protein